MSVEERSELQYEKAVLRQIQSDSESQRTAKVVGHDGATGLDWVALVGSGPTKATSFTTASLPVGDQVSYFAGRGGRGFVNKLGAI